MKTFLKFLFSLFLEWFFPSKKPVETDIYEKNDPDNSPTVITNGGTKKVNFSAKKYDELKKQSPHYRKGDY